MILYEKTDGFVHFYIKCGSGGLVRRVHKTLHHSEKKVDYVTPAIKPLPFPNPEIKHDLKVWNGEPLPEPTL